MAQYSPAPLCPSVKSSGQNHGSQRLRSVLWVFSFMGYAIILTSCGGPRPEAKVAQFLQNTLIEVLTSVVMGTGDNQNVTSSCSKGGEITVAFDGPTDIIGDIGNIGDAPLYANISFDSCQIDACGETVTLNGGGARINLGNAPDYLEESGSESGTAIDLTLEAAALSANGFVSGPLTFSYNLKTIVAESGTSLQSILISDPDPNNAETRFNYNGYKFSGEDVTTLPDGC